MGGGRKGTRWGHPESQGQFLLLVRTCPLHVDHPSPPQRARAPSQGAHLRGFTLGPCQTCLSSGSLPEAPPPASGRLAGPQHRWKRISVRPQAEAQGPGPLALALVALSSVHSLCDSTQCLLTVPGQRGHGGSSRGRRLDPPTLPPGAWWCWVLEPGLAECFPVMRFASRLCCWRGDSTRTVDRAPFRRDWL